MCRLNTLTLQVVSQFKLEHGDTRIIPPLHLLMYVRCKYLWLNVNVDYYGKIVEWSVHYNFEYVKVLIVAMCEVYSLCANRENFGWCTKL